MRVYFLSYLQRKCLFTECSENTDPCVTGLHRFAASFSGMVGHLYEYYVPTGHVLFSVTYILPTAMLLQKDC
jgi:hypothetical protein